MKTHIMKDELRTALEEFHNNFTQHSEEFLSYENVKMMTSEEYGKQVSDYLWDLIEGDNHELIS